jgi:acetylornithine aminotransferase
MQLFDVYPLLDITIIKGLGSHIWDSAGNKYLDFYGGHAVISIGHSHPHYIYKINQQLEQIGFYSNSVKIPQQALLAEKLGILSKKEDYNLFLCNSGAEANENAMKLASFHTGRHKVIAFSRSFHGRTSLAVAATDSPALVAPVNKTDNIVFLPFNDVEALSDYFKKHGHEVAAVITEGIQGVGGINVAETEFLQSIRSHCDNYGALYIADSVQCGYGRSGKFFSHDFAEVSADIYTMAKGMGNGFPVAGIIIAPHIKARHGMLGTTFGGNHLACAAALAVLDVMEEDDLLVHAAAMGDYLMLKLKEMEELHHVRGRGLMVGFDVPEAQKDLKQRLLQKHHIFTGEAKPNVIRLLPALNIMKDDVDYLLHAISQELKS